MGLAVMKGFFDSAIAPLRMTKYAIFAENWLAIMEEDWASVIFSMGIF